MKNILDARLSLDTFNDYNLLEIISCLSLVDRISVARVCKRWKSLVDETLRKVVTINCYTVLGKRRSKISFQGLATVIRKCPNLKHIDFENFRLPKISDNSYVVNMLLEVAFKSESLETINLDTLPVSKTAISELIQCSKLWKFASKEINEHLFNAYVIGLPALKSVDLSGNNKLTGNAFDMFGPNLEELKLENCFNTSNSKEALHNLAMSSGKHLKKLSVIAKNFQSFELICAHFEKLTHLKLCFIGFNCDFSQMWRLKNLISVSFETWAECNFRDKQLSELLQSCRHLDIREFNIAGKFECVDSLTHLPQCCPRIEKLVLRNFIDINKDVDIIAKLENLTHLDLMNTDIGKNIKTVIKFCPKLRSLNLHNCANVGYEVLDEFIKICEANPKEWHDLDVIETSIRSVGTRKLPKNLILLISVIDCKYSCDHYSYLYYIE